MLKHINRLRGCGVFKDYAKPQAIEPFGEKNILYGWNYSGKTTLSRVFGMLAEKTVPADFPGLQFNLTDHANNTISEDNLSLCTKKVVVFNQDFVQSNLSWHGESFQPILLLGDDSIEAEKKIAEIEEKIIQCRVGYGQKRDAVAAADNKIADSKTVSAKQVKTTLQIVEAYTATHLSQDVALVTKKAEEFILTGDSLAENLKLALMAKKDVLPPVPTVNATSRLHALSDSAAQLLEKVPDFSNTIDYLKSNPEISEWVEAGVRIHKQRESCEFCTSVLPAHRMAELQSHFSKDVLTHKSNLRSLGDTLRSAKLTFNFPIETQLNPQFRAPLAQLENQLNKLALSYNAAMEELLRSVDKKIANQFDRMEVPFFESSLISSISSSINAMNVLIESNNKSIDSFPSEKSAAITKLKRHFAANFFLDNGLARTEQSKVRWNNHMLRYKKFAEIKKSEIQALHATINRAQKGRERINSRISTMLGTEGIQISVVQVAGEDRFQLTRKSIVARNLSEGEKTAIAFAFFLTKLEEHQSIQDLIVYIDDPISSLDANHIFQVFSIIRTTFFIRKTQDNSQQWTTSCKQLFISTHNFDFFSLLRKLPIGAKKSRYYLVKRISDDQSTLIDMPDSLLKYTSEYHYLFGVIYSFHTAQDKTSIDLLLSLPNALRRFLELYTYSRLPLSIESTVDQRAEILFGAEKAVRITKVLHHFSHLESMERLILNTDLISDIEAVIDEVINHVSQDEMHFAALKQSFEGSAVEVGTA